MNLLLLSPRHACTVASTGVSALAGSRTNDGVGLRVRVVWKPSPFPRLLSVFPRSYKNFEPCAQASASPKLARFIPKVTRFCRAAGLLPRVRARLRTKPVPKQAYQEREWPVRRDVQARKTGACLYIMNVIMWVFTGADAWMLPEAARLKAESPVHSVRTETSDAARFTSEASFRSTDAADENPSPEPEGSGL